MPGPWHNEETAEPLSCNELAVPKRMRLARFELATFTFGVCYSILLSYSRIFGFRTC